MASSKLVDDLANTLEDVEAKTLVDSLNNLKAKAIVHTDGETLLEIKTRHLPTHRVI